MVIQRIVNYMRATLVILFFYWPSAWGANGGSVYFFGTNMADIDFAYSQENYTCPHATNGPDVPCSTGLIHGAMDSSSHVHGMEQGHLWFPNPNPDYLTVYQSATTANGFKSIVGRQEEGMLRAAFMNRAVLDPQWPGKLIYKAKGTLFITWKDGTIYRCENFVVGHELSGGGSVWLGSPQGHAFVINYNDGRKNQGVTMQCNGRSVSFEMGYTVWGNNAFPGLRVQCPTCLKQEDEPGGAKDSSDARPASRSTSG